MTPKQTTQSAHNGKQGNATRQELFIALKYLLDKCPDEKNTSKTTELQEYAKNNFGVLLDRRRVNDIFDSLVDFTQNNRGVIPYVVKKVEDKPRYYIKKDLFNNKEIECIAKAIQNDPSISSTRANKYINSFLNTVCSKADKEKIDRKLKRTEVHKMRASDLEMEFQEYFSYLRDTQKRFYFKFKQPIRPGDCTDKNFCRQVQKAGPNKEYAGIVFDLYTIKKQVDVCIYLPDLRCAVIAHQQDMVSPIYHTSIKLNEKECPIDVCYNAQATSFFYNEPNFLMVGNITTLFNRECCINYREMKIIFN